MANRDGGEEPHIATLEVEGRTYNVSVRVVFDANGTILARMDYKPFGQDLSGASGMPATLPDHHQPTPARAIRASSSAVRASASCFCASRGKREISMTLSIMRTAAAAPRFTATRRAV